MAIVPVNKEAGDPPVGKPDQSLLISLPQLDAREFVGWTELAPTNSARAIVNEGGVCGACTDASLLLAAVWWMWLRFRARSVKAHAPAPAPHAVVLFHQACKIGPCGWVERLDGEGGGCRDARLRGFAAGGRMWGSLGEAWFSTQKEFLSLI